MISAADVVRRTELTAADVMAIMAKGRMPPVSAAMLGSYLLHAYKGPERVQEMICDDIRGALHVDDLDRARRLYATLHRFLSEWPGAARQAE